MSEPRLDAYRTGHASSCSKCGYESVVPLAICRLERDPWRLIWQCLECRKTTNILVQHDVVPVLRGLDVAGGMKISVRESELWRFADADDLTEAFVEELF